MAYVYWIEADEEARFLVPNERHISGRRSFLAYTLLQVEALTHPADIFQSTASHDLFFDPKAQPLLQKIVQLHLGDSSSVTDYMADRVEKLRHDKASAREGAFELQQYSRYGATLRSKASELDGLFTDPNVTFPIAGSRDARFRQLLRDDLLSEIPVGFHLSWWIRQGLNRNDADRMLKFLVDFVDDPREFVNIDAIITHLVQARCPANSLNNIHRRLLILHWEARSDGQVDIPFLSRAKGTKLNPLDPYVFWIAVDGLLGPQFQSDLMTLPWPIALGIAEELRRDGVWSRFIETYRAIVYTVDRDHEHIFKLMVKSEVARRQPGFARIVWNNRPDRWSVLSLVCFAGSTAAGVTLGWPLVWKVGSGLGAAKKFYDIVSKIVNAFYASDKHLLVTRIYRMLEDAKKG